MLCVPADPRMCTKFAEKLLQKAAMPRNLLTRESFRPYGILEYLVYALYIAVCLKAASYIQAVIFVEHVYTCSSSIYTCTVHVCIHLQTYHPLALHMHYLGYLDKQNSSLFQRNGQYEFSIDADEYRSKVRYRYDPFCVRSSIRITAEVTEGGRNTTQSDSIVVPLVSNPISLSFDENTPTVFRPGLAYTFIVRTMYMYVCTCMYILWAQFT